MDEPFSTVFRVLHAGGGWLAFGVAPFALRAAKGGRHHKLAGRCFVASMSTGVTAGILLATVRLDFVRDLFLLGLMTLFFLDTGIWRLASAGAPDSTLRGCAACS